MNWTYLWLIIAIAFEVIGTSALKETQGFTRLNPSVLSLAAYGFAFYFLSLALKILPMGVVYAVWSGAGIVFIAAIGWLVFRQALDMPALIGIALIIAGVAIINLFSKTMAH